MINTPSTHQALAQQVAASIEHFTPEQADYAAGLILWKIFLAQQHREAEEVTA